MKKFLCGFFLTFIAFCAFAQSAEKVSKIIESGEISVGQTSYLAGVYAGLIPENASESEAFKVAVEKNWISSAKSEGDSISLAELSKICVEASGLRCGLLYMVTSLPRYAFKELKARNILDSQADPSMTVSGQNAVAVMNACIDGVSGGSNAQ